VAEGAIIPVYIDPNGQPFFDERGNLLLGATSAPKSGVDAIREMIAAHAEKTGQRFELRGEPLAAISRTGVGGKPRTLA
jgi:hypothetical protein